MGDPAAARMAAEVQRQQEVQQLRQLMLLRQRYWERLFLTAVEMSEPELRAALRHPSTDRRFAATYVVGERLLPWHKDLIPLLQDRSEGVRQAARRSLIILSFLALKPDEARQIRARQRPGSATPLSQLQKPVDFGPNPGAGPAARAEAVRRWREWWEGQESRPGATSELVTTSGRNAAGTEGERLASTLLEADASRRPQIVARYRDSKGGHFTEALALAAARESGEGRRGLREALADRMARMTDKTLGRYLEDEDPEVRRAAALGLAMRESKAQMDRLIGLLLDPEPAVERAAHAALRSLSGEDFGPRVNATEDEKTEAAGRWRKWWEGKRPPR